VTDWLAFCRAAAAAVERALAELPRRTDREPVVALGEGGDETTAIDAAAESAVVSLLERLHAGGAEFTLVS
jgi:fructose-1,6-bisphosphatase/inositol monophosphatase family enzyme